MGKITISLPDDVTEYVEAQVGEDFADAGAYVAELVRRDQEEQENRLNEIRRSIDESLASGISTRTFEERIAEGDRVLRSRGLLDG